MSKRKATTTLKRATKRPRLTKRRSSIKFQPVSFREKKNFDTTTNSTIVAAQATSVVTSIFQPDQGTAPIEHIGRALTSTSLFFRWTGSYAPTTAGSSPIRLIIVYDKQPNAALPAATAILEVDTIGSCSNLQNSRRFIFLVDKMVDQFSDAGPKSFSIEGYRRMNLNTEFNDTNGGTIADITTGSYIALTIQNGNIITANPTSNLFTRIRFDDS